MAFALIDHLKPPLRAALILMLLAQSEAFAAPAASPVASPNLPQTAEASLALMSARPGFRVELLAAEPLVMDPVDVAWGPDGRMWVCEMADYPIGVDNKNKTGSRIVCITDSDGDGRLDKRTVFADELAYANTVMPWRDGALVLAAPNVWFMRDTDGDGRADDRRVLFEGFGEGNQQHRSSGLVWGLDGWLYLTNGDSGGNVRSLKTGKVINLGGFDLRIRPDTGELEHATGITQHGRSRDDWGNWVAGNNSGAWQIAVEDHHIRRNPSVSQPPARHTLFGVIDLYPSSQVLGHSVAYEPPPPGTPDKLTSGCGYTFYRDSLFDGHVQPSVYVSCPVHNCVHREEISWDGVLMTTRRAADEAQTEFLRSSDSWFRPTAIRTAPDGSLVVADMYRFVIEHPEWIGKTLLAEMIEDGRLRAGEDKGRIYRVYPTAATLRRPMILSGKEPQELAAALDTSNGWQRDTAHQMLTWLDKADQQRAIPGVRKIFYHSEHASARTQALSVLADLGSLRPAEVATAFADKHPGVRRNALRVGAFLFTGHPDLGRLALPLLRDDDSQVQREAAYAIGQWPDERAGEAIAKFALTNAEHPYLRAAALTSAGKFPDVALATILGAEQSPATASLVNAMLDMLGREDAGEIAPGVLERLAAKKTPAASYEAWQFDAAARLVNLIGDSTKQESALKEMSTAARKNLDDPECLLSLRLAAISLLVATENSADRSRFAGLLTVNTPIELQIASVRALLLGASRSEAQSLLDGWSEFSADVRVAILDSLLARSEQTQVLLDAIAENSEIGASLDVARRQLLLSHEDLKTRERAASLLGGATSKNRAAVIEKYAAALIQPGSRMDGKAVFAATCAACHQLDGIGNSIGPDLAALSSRDPQTYLRGILDPNQAIQGNWIQFIAKTNDGRTLAGSIAEETSSAVTIIGVDGTMTTVPRAELVSLKSTGRSFMPEGLEAAISINQMSDLLAYLGIAGRPRKSFAGNEPQLIQPADDDTLTMPATAAEIYGPNLVFEPGYKNLGFWSSGEDRSEWLLRIASEKIYELWAEWALPGEAPGGRISFSIDGQTLVSSVPGTGSWDDYRWGRVGTLKLSAGKKRMVVQSEGALPPASPLIDLRQLRLIPQNQPAFEGGVNWPIQKKEKASDVTDEEPKQTSVPH